MWFDSSRFGNYEEIQILLQADPGLKGVLKINA